ncbi:MAG: phosphatidate cytidylyltransferase [Oscillospiraceae bacterium]|jgi:phosphatidate cytidylyltransferase|nr:phosphatidate cytidylyltransferase [Oscillospiraceae bacterium]
MKIRIITGLFWAAVAITALVKLDSPLLGILLIPFTAMACYEICHVAKIKNKALLWLAVAVAALVPPYMEHHWRLPAFLQLRPVALVAVLAAVFCVLALVKSEQTRFEHILFAVLGAVVVPAGLSSLTVLRDLIMTAQRAMVAAEPTAVFILSVYMLFFTFCCAWLTDTFAYFVGSKLGKHKLAPKISPKKTVEGAIGGMLCTLIANLGFALLFNNLFLQGVYKVNLVGIALLTIPLCMISILGDLCFSLMKRNFDTKDFGRFFPGHGGVMDRFDSLVVVAPGCALLLQWSLDHGFALFYRQVTEWA